MNLGLINKPVYLFILLIYLLFIYLLFIYLFIIYFIYIFYLFYLFIYFIIFVLAVRAHILQKIARTGDCVLNCATFTHTMRRIH